ncbi:SWIM zinc finger family protein [Natronococcus occultus]|nr:SWIM zinc finger family protein [Natronococcus occultus]
MEAIETSGEKSIVDELNFGKKTAKRVAWESWEFTVVGPHQVKVTNASYGYLKDDHAYVVGVEVRNGRPVPVECDCPADQFSEEYACKHRVALAAIGGPTVLNAAVACETPKSDTDPDPDAVETANTAADKLQADGGVPAETEEPAECDCTREGGFPCWPCFRDGEAE